jgi:transposase
MDVLDKDEQFKGHYIVMNNAPIHNNSDIEKEINRRGYGCIYLPPYSQFWSVCKKQNEERRAVERRDTVFKNT